MKTIATNLALIFSLFSSMIYADTALDEKIQTRIKELQKMQNQMDRVADKNCQAFEQQNELIEEESGNTITLKESVDIAQSNTKFQLIPGDKIMYLSSTLRKQGDAKVRVKYSASGNRKGSGYISAKMLKHLQELNNIIPKDCL